MSGPTNGRQCRVRYWQVASLDAALEISRGLGARTVVLDVEPLVAAWRDGQQALAAA